MQGFVWYSIRDEAFYNDDELNNGKAPTGAEVTWMEEETYFFKLSEFGDKLLKYYEDNPDFIAPKSRKNEVISFIKSGLKDLSISRTSFKWGVPVPNDEKHIMYVWLDALTNYLSALDFPDMDSNKFKNFWPADIHLVGKDILRFHAIFWPAFLMAADLPIPKRIFAHGWWTNEGEKISKSLGNVIDPLALIEEFGLDQTRYFLMRQVPFGQDGNYAKEEMILRINSDLANNIGNLTQRSLSMITKNCDAKIPKAGDFNAEDKKLLDLAYNLKTTLDSHIEQQNFHLYLQDIIKQASLANEYIDKQAPWQLKKTDFTRMETVLYVLAENIRIIAILLQPFMPESMAKILTQLNINATTPNFAQLENKLAAKHQINKNIIIFPRILS